jgi:hypothetical protein
MRFALYFIPGPGNLLNLATSWLGYDIITGRAAKRPQTLMDLVPNIDKLTAIPSRYGLHATLKAPFSLAIGNMPVHLRDAVQDFCKTRQPLALPGLALKEMNSFVCLVPMEDTDKLTRLAESVVREFDRFRAPLGENERQRRMAKNLTAPEQLHLDQWGYPYVMENFRFHISLTGPLADTSARQEIRRLLEVFLHPALCLPLQIDALCLVREREPGVPFELVARFFFTG